MRHTVWDKEGSCKPLVALKIHHYYDLLPTLCTPLTMPYIDHVTMLQLRLLKHHNMSDFPGGKRA